MAPVAVRLIAGPDFSAAAPVLRFTAFLVFLTGLSAALGQMVMIPFGLNKDFSYSYFIASGVAVVLLPALCVMYGVMGAVAAVLVVEIVVTASMLTFIYIRLPWFRPFGLGRGHV